MSANYDTAIMNALNAQGIIREEVVQQLWSGYGELKRLWLDGGEHPSVILKHIRLADNVEHPRGWNTSTSHQRKVKSYEVEWYWYQHYAAQCNNLCRVPKHLASQHNEQERFLLLEDLNASGYTLRKQRLTVKETELCLQWLAHFHATFMGVKPKGLWETGTYWHLATRPDEWKAMAGGPLKAAAHTIDKRLTNCSYQTLVHGDAKVANFCFTPDMQNVAAVDFQYVGGGCGIKDVVYLLGSCLSESECAQYETQLLDVYFSTLGENLQYKYNQEFISLIEQEWRGLYALAWTDFTRFLLGWMPSHQKITGYSLQLMKQVLNTL